MIRSRWLPILLLVGALIASRASAQQPIAPPLAGDVRVAAPAQQAGPMIFYFAVLGEVGVPGVYEFTTPNPPLLEVIQRAGGLTSTATGQVGIIRNGRGGHKSFYSSQLKEQLLPGDVLVADADPRTGGSAAPFLAPNSTSQQRLPDAQLAFVGLLDRPVIVKMHGEQATIANIVSFLGQPNEILPSIRIIDTARVTRPSNGQLPSTTPLPSGTVLVFDPSAVVFDRIPETVLASLPLPYRAPDTMIAMAPTGPATLPQEQIAAPTPLPVQAAPAIAAPTATAALPTPVGPEVAATDAASIDSPTLADNSRVRDSDVRLSPNTKTPLPTNLSATAVCVIACLASLSAFAVLWSLMPRTIAPAAAAATQVATSRRVSAPQLAALLEDDDPVTEEPLASNDAVRSALLTIGAKKLRVDGAHDPQRPAPARTAEERTLRDPVRVPRTRVDRAQSAHLSQADERPDIVLPPESAGPSQRLRGERPKSGLLDRVLSSMQGNRRP